MGNTTTEDKEKAEVLNAFFTFIFNSQSGYPRGTQPHLEIWDVEQNKPPKPSQHRFTKGKSCLTTLISSYDW